jgi:hypothetical protein
MSDITSYFVKTIDQTESFVLVLYVDQFIKQALASLIVYVSEIGWSRVIFDYLWYFAELLFGYALVDSLQTISRAAHDQL